MCPNLECYVLSLSSKPSRPWAHVPPRHFHAGAHASRRLLTLRLKTCSLFTLFTNTITVPWMNYYILKKFVPNCGMEDNTSLLTMYQLSEGAVRVTQREGEPYNSNMYTVLFSSGIDMMMVLCVIFRYRKKGMGAGSKQRKIIHVSGIRRGRTT